MNPESSSSVHLTRLFGKTLKTHIFFLTAFFPFYKEKVLFSFRFEKCKFGKMETVMVNKAKLIYRHVNDSLTQKLIITCQRKKMSFPVFFTFKLQVHFRN